ncbi:MAG: hypothetical protein DMF56_11700 [Acidobacteria bacterium]|nr:MAG: hypothetical protein DMF56_11700 [Acidobacteriota bacterium]
MNLSISDAARKQLRGVPSEPFAVDGFAEFQSSVERYIDDLIMESVQVMRRHDSASISPQYVKMAAQNIIRRRGRKLSALISAAGGACLAGAVTCAWEIAQHKATPSATIAAFVFLAVGLTLTFVYANRQ